MLLYISKSFLVEAEKIFNRPQLAQLFFSITMCALALFSVFYLVWSNGRSSRVDRSLLSLRAFLVLRTKRQAKNTKVNFQFRNHIFFSVSSQFDKVSQRFSIVFIIPSLALLPLSPRLNLYVCLERDIVELLAELCVCRVWTFLCFGQLPGQPDVEQNRPSSI